MTRKEFLQTATGAVAAAGVPSNTATAAPEKKGPKRGVSVYSYACEMDVDATLEDCLAEISDLATPSYPMGVELLANGHIDGYPNPTDAWVRNWHEMRAKYEILPVELGHWIDSKLYNEGPEDLLSTKESVAKLIDDIKLGNRLGFTRGRTKLGMFNNDGMPTPNWREIIKAALPAAQKYNFRMLTEIHSPTPLKGRVMDEFMDFITKENCNPWFGINVDFSVFQNKPGTASSGAGARRVPDPQVAQARPARRMPLSQPEDIIPILPYVHCCHAKFNEINRDCEDQTIPYPQIIKVLVDNQWDGYMMSEYEGTDKATGGGFSAVRRQHVLLKRLLSEA